MKTLVNRERNSKSFLESKPWEYKKRCNQYWSRNLTRWQYLACELNKGKYLQYIYYPNYKTINSTDLVLRQ